MPQTVRKCRKKPDDPVFFSFLSLVCRNCFNRACTDAGMAVDAYCFITLGLSLIIKSESSNGANTYTGSAADADILIYCNRHVNYLLPWLYCIIASFYIQWFPFFRLFTLSFR